MDSPNVLFVGGVDSSHGAGLDADHAAAVAFECEPITVASAFTDQDLFEVRRVEERLLWNREAETLIDRNNVAAMKFGLLPGVASIVEAARLIARNRNAAAPLPAVVDPVIRSSSGYRFWSDRELVSVRDSLLLAGPILTPNLDELAELAWADRAALDESLEARVDAARTILRGGASAVVVTGGHGASNEDVRDLVLETEGEPLWIERVREPGNGIRGSGCRFAAALACALARGMDLGSAARAAGDLVAQQIREAE